MNWDHYFLKIAEITASKSKDPSTKVGSVVVRPDNTIVSLGYNGFPRNIEDTPERLANREVKYQLVVHAEMNAILSARESLAGCSLYVHPLMPCDRCFVHIIQTGIRRIVFPRASDEHLKRWGDAFLRVWDLAREAKITMVEYDLPKETSHV